MRKTAIIIITIFVIIIAIVSVNLKAISDDKKAVQQFNQEYEHYLGKKVYGTEVTTVINKAIENNKKYNISKDEDGMYIDDEKNCIKVELNMVTVEKTFQMEQLYKAGITEFVKNFNTIYFECNNIEYHKETGKVSKIVFTEIEENFDINILD